jgi:hypothetical protein
MERDRDANDAKALELIKRRLGGSESNADSTLRAQELLDELRWLDRGGILVDILRDAGVEIPPERLAATQAIGIFADALYAFRDTDNRLFFAEAFVKIVDMGQQPPFELLRWVADALRGWLDRDGDADIGQLLDLKPGRGKTSLFSRFELDARNVVLMRDMNTLVQLGATREDAAAIVRDRIPAWADLPESETLLRMYTAHASSERCTMDDDSRREFLRRFQPTYMNSKLKSMR